MCTKHLEHVFLWVDSCLVKIKISLKFMQESPTTFTFPLFPVFPHHNNLMYNQKQNLEFNWYLYYIFTHTDR